MNHYRSISALGLYLLGGGLLCAAQNPEVTGVALKVENDLTDCMEKRRLTFTANTSVTWHEGGPYRIHYKLNMKGPTGGYNQFDEDWTMEQQCVFDEYQVPLVPRTGAKDYTLQAYATAVDEGGYYSEMVSNTMSIDARRLWIEEFKDAQSGKDWKVCVGRPITYKAYTSTDVGAHSFYWAMKDHDSEVWEVTTVNTKSGSDMSIPYWNLGAVSPTKHNSDFGDVHGTVYVQCEDSEENTFKLYSSEMEGNSKKAQVFFDPEKSTGGETPSDSSPPCWYIFWKDGGVVSNLADTAGYKHQTGNWGVTYGTDVYVCTRARDIDFPLTTLVSIVDGTTFTIHGTGREYLDMVFMTVEHEKYHAYVNGTWGSYSPGPGEDNDGLPAAEENNPTAYKGITFPKSSPTNPDSFGFGPYNGDYQDNEVRCRIVEGRVPISTVDPSKDWSVHVKNPKW